MAPAVKAFQAEQCRRIKKRGTEDCSPETFILNNARPHERRYHESIHPYGETRDDARYRAFLVPAFPVKSEQQRRREYCDRFKRLQPYVDEAVEMPDRYGEEIPRKIRPMIMILLVLSIIM